VLTELLYLCLGIKPSILALYTTALSGATGPLKYTIVKCLQCTRGRMHMWMCWCVFTCEWTLSALRACCLCSPANLWKRTGTQQGIAQTQEQSRDETLAARRLNSVYWLRLDGCMATAAAQSLRATIALFCSIVAVGKSVCVSVCVCVCNGRGMHVKTHDFWTGRVWTPTWFFACVCVCVFDGWVVSVTFLV